MILDERQFKTITQAKLAAQAEANKSQRLWYVMGSLRRYRIAQDAPPDTLGLAYVAVEPEAVS